MGNVFRSVMKMYNLAAGDFPDLPLFQSIAREQDFNQFAKLKLSMLEGVEAVLSTDIPRLMDALPRSLDDGSSSIVVFSPSAPLGGRAAPPSAVTMPPPPPISTMSSNSFKDEPVFAEAVKAEANPFDDDDFGEGKTWGLQDYIPMYQGKFNDTQENGFVSGVAAKNLLIASGLPRTVLKQIWDLADVGKDGKLDLFEFVIAMFFSDMVKEGHELPTQLDPSMRPPPA